MTHNFTTNSEVELKWKGGEGQLAAQGPFSGGTLSIKFSMDNGTTWTLLKKIEEAGANDPSLTEAGSFAFKSMRTDEVSYRLQVALTGATNPSILVRIGDHVS